MNHMLCLGLAPMAGLTDWPMRALCYRMGADYTCTEMVSAVGLMCAKRDNEAYRRLLTTAPDEPNTSCQLFGKDPVAMSEAAARVTELGRFTALDVNMGCPARKIVSIGEGSALLKTPDLAYRVLEAVKRSTCLPVTVKTRLGFDEDSMNASAIVKAAQSLGLQWVTLHGRTRAQQYAGKADYEAIARVKRDARIPVIANGDVFTPEDAERILLQTGCDGLMIGRGALGNPWLFRAMRQALSGQPVTTETLRERAETAMEHARMMVAFKGEGLGIREMRTHIGHYVRGVRGAANLRRELVKAETLAQLEALLTTQKEQIGEERNVCE